MTEETVAENEALTWTTADEVAFIDQLFLEGRSSGNWGPLKNYPATVARRSWDPDVDAEVVFLVAQRAVSRMDFVLGRGEKV